MFEKYYVKIYFVEEKGLERQVCNSQKGEGLFCNVLEGQGRFCNSQKGDRLLCTF